MSILLCFLQNLNFMVGFSNSSRRDPCQQVGTASLLEVAPHDSSRLRLSHLTRVLLHTPIPFQIWNANFVVVIFAVVIFTVLIFANDSKLAKNAKINSPRKLPTIRYDLLQALLSPVRGGLEVVFCHQVIIFLEALLSKGYNCTM